MVGGILRCAPSVAERRGDPAGCTAPARADAERPTWWRELALLVGLYVLYEVGRGLGTGGTGAAMRNGRAILAWEQGWHLDAEQVLNQALGHLTPVAVLAAFFYATLHYVVTPAVLLWMYRCHMSGAGGAMTAASRAGWEASPTSSPPCRPCTSAGRCGQESSSRASRRVATSAGSAPCTRS